MGTDDVIGRLQASGTVSEPLSPNSGLATVRAESPLRVAVVASTDFSGYPYGGTAGLVHDVLAHSNLSEDDRITLVGLSREGQEYPDEGSRNCGKHRFSFLAVSKLSSRRRLPVRVRMLSGLVSNIRAIRQLRALVFYAHSPEIARTLRLVAPATPIVLHCHGIDNPLRLAKYRIARLEVCCSLYDRLVMRPALQGAARILVNADPAEFSGFVSRYSTIPRGRFERLRPALDLETFCPGDKAEARAALDIGPNSRLGIFTGRLEPSKGLDLVLHAVAGIRKRNPAFEFIVVGDGTARESLRQLANSLGIKDSVRFMGALSRMGVRDALRSADVFMTGSIREAISMALLEAMGCGLPAVVVETGGARELVHDGENGFVITERNPVDMAERALEVLECSHVLGTQSVRIAQAYDARKVAERVLTILREAGVGQR